MNPSKNTVLITGGASGIGRALAMTFLKKDNRVINVGRNSDKLDGMKELHPDILVHICYVSKQGEQDNLNHTIESQHSDINIGKTKPLRIIQRIFPSLADKIVKDQ